MAPLCLALIVAGFGFAGCEALGPKIEIPVGEGTSEAGPPAPNRAPSRRPVREGEGTADPVTENAATELQPVAEPEAEAEPDAPKSAAQITCEKGGGRYLSWGGSIAKTCFTTPRDAGKYCKKSTDCSGKCLARSLTCAPIAPLFGCHEVLTDRGVRVTECLE